MMKRSFFLVLAAGLIASLAFNAPAQAGSTMVTTTASFAITPTTTTATDLEFSYTAATGPVTIISSSGLSPLASSYSGDTITLTFGPTAAGSVEFSYMTSAAPPVYLTGPPALTGLSGSYSSATVTYSVVSSAVPEPSSMALLGIGMTGFLAFRRFFKRASVA